MTATQLSSLLAIDDSVRLLDVRTASEFENAHIAGAYNVPLDQLHEHSNEVRHASRQVVLICQSGGRAAQAELLLRSKGMENVRVLDGGMKSWIALGFGVRRIRARVSLERQVRVLAGAIVAVASIAAMLLSPLFAIVSIVIGCGLVFAGVTDTCGMGMMLAKLPYNRGAMTCDTETIVRQFLS